MTNPKNRPDADELRQRAEQRLAQQERDAVAPAANAMRQLHELQVHQIELEMQNEALTQAQAETEDTLRQLGELNASLEQQVQARTTELVSARDAAEAAHRAKSNFLSNMSHELRTPLSGVMGMIDLALGIASDARQADWLRKAKMAAEHLLLVVDDVMDISRIDAGRVRLQSVSFSLGKVLDELSAFVAPAAARQGLAFRRELPEDLACQVLQGDSFRLKQILLNLVGNAVKFTAAGEVGLSVQWVQDSATEMLLRFEVHDSGIGITQEDQMRLFSAFEQADNAVTRKFSGTGLGLAISARLVRMMGGSIGVNSAPGAGSRFWFTAQFGKAEATPAPAQRPTH